MALTLDARIERWPIAGTFTISRGSKTEAVVVVAELSDGRHAGRGECTPYPRYGESPDGVLRALEAMKRPVADGLDRVALQQAMPAGAARNALDCAFWDYEAKSKGVPAWQLAGLAPPRPLTTAYTISLGTPQEMAARARSASQRPLLKLKLGGAGDEARLSAVRRAAPHCQLIVDANEAWTPDLLEENLAACAALGVTLVEQPLPAGNDGVLATIKRPVAVCADESVHDRASLSRLADKYDAINIKLDKAGGLTEALALAQAARRCGLEIMAGCMVATSLAMAPAILVGQQARVVDLDGPLLLARDRQPGLRYETSRVHPPEPALWG
jgi:L-alanine-DL-glutamate epimerase-like enolase superfamily enzyme